MKNKILKKALLILISIFSVSLMSFQKNLTENEPSINDEMIFILPMGQTISASDGTFIAASGEDRTYRFCPGSGWRCSGAILTGGVFTTYKGTKGFFKPDVIIEED